MRIAAYQFAPVPGDAAANAASVESALRAAAAENIKLLALPELWTVSFAFTDAGAATAASARAVADICKLSKELGIVVAGSGLEQSGADRPYNCAHVISDGKVILQYSKSHLFPPTREDAVFMPGGEHPGAVDTPAGRVSMVICYDLRFPEICRYAFLENAEIVIVPAQWAVEREPQFRALIAGRAVENQCIYLGVNRTGTETGPLGNLLRFPGCSIISNAFGETLALGGSEPGLVAAEIDLERQAALRRMIPCAKSRREDLY